MGGGIAIQKAMNTALVGRGGAVAQKWPGSAWDRRSFRGSGIAAEALNFWRDLDKKSTDEEKTYRIPSPLSTSVNEAVSQNFLRKVRAPLVPVMFECRWESGQSPCLHARYIEGISAVGGEEEITLAGFSAVLLVKMDETMNPLTITIKVLKDNKAVPESVPL